MHHSRFSEGCHTFVAADAFSEYLSTSLHLEVGWDLAQFFRRAKKSSSDTDRESFVDPDMVVDHISPPCEEPFPLRCRGFQRSGSLQRTLSGKNGIRYIGCP